MLLACDSAVTDIFAPLHQNPPDVAAFSIGAYDPWIWNHATPEQVWSMFLQTGAHYLIPLHWGTFRLSKEPMDEPLVFSEDSVTDIPQVNGSCLRPATAEQHELADAFEAANRQGHRWEAKFSIAQGYRLIGTSREAANGLLGVPGTVNRFVVLAGHSARDVVKIAAASPAYVWMRRLRAAAIWLPKRLHIVGNAEVIKEGEWVGGFKQRFLLWLGPTLPLGRDYRPRLTAK